MKSALFSYSYFDLYAHFSLNISSLVRIEQTAASVLFSFLIFLRVLIKALVKELWSLVSGRGSSVPPRCTYKLPPPPIV